MPTFEERLNSQATLGLDVTERVLKGEDVAGLQTRTALSVIKAKLTHESVQNGRVSRIISLAKLGVTDAAVRQRIAEAALMTMLPGVAMSQIGAAAEQPAALRSGGAGEAS